jgi:deferrochelatase/peroxidase EfeB
VLDSASPGLVLFQDPFVPAGEGYGSFLSFFKFAQDVSVFHAAAAGLNTSLPSNEEAQASLIGRYQNGTPLLPGRNPKGAATVDNNFDYTGDPKGIFCPYSSHVRKMNQRDGRHPEIRIARRGMTYGPDWRVNKDPGAERGLLFMSYQSSIFGTLRVLIEHWANNENFPIPGTGVDPVISYSGSTYLPIGRDAVPKEVQRFVSFVGGALFFVPSPAFFKKF